MKIKNLAGHEKPRERLKLLGSENLKLSELLSLLLRTGTKSKDVLTLASEILTKYDLAQLVNLTYEQLLEIKGISSVKASAVIAAIELGKRINVADLAISIGSTEEAINYLYDLRGLKKEYFICLYLNARNQLIHRETITIGSINFAVVNPRDVFIPALEHSALYILLAHNHPAGSITPSITDLEITKRLAVAGRYLNIEIIDHIIVTSNQHYSFKDNHML